MPVAASRWEEGQQPHSCLNFALRLSLFAGPFPLPCLSHCLSAPAPGFSLLYSGPQIYSVPSSINILATVLQKYVSLYPTCTLLSCSPSLAPTRSFFLFHSCSPEAGSFLCLSSWEWQGGLDLPWNLLGVMGRGLQGDRPHRPLNCWGGRICLSSHQMGVRAYWGKANDVFL